MADDELTDSLTDSQKIFIQAIRDAIHEQMEQERHWVVRFVRDVLSYAVGILKKL